MNTNCHSCAPTSPEPAKESYGVMTGLMLALLPKCPFCIMAFTGTAMLCGEGTVVEISSTQNSLATILITAVLCFLTFIGIALNKRGNRTLYAIAIALTGMAMVMFSVIKSGGQPLYYAGIVVMFLGVWMNGSFVWFAKKLGSIRPRHLIN